MDIELNRHTASGFLGDTTWYTAKINGELIYLGTTKSDAEFKLRRVKRNTPNAVMVDRFNMWAGKRYDSLMGRA